MLGLSTKSGHCPFCYLQIDVTKLAFRCSGRGVPGREPCERVRDEALASVLGNSRPYLPVVTEGRTVTLGKTKAVCEDCGGESRIRICPHCHSTLPYNFSAESPMFGLIGVPYSGKTVMLTVLHRELLSTVGRRFNAAIDTPGGSDGLGRDLEDFLEQMTQGHLPAKTNVSSGKKQAPVVYEWSYTQGRKSKRTIFSFYDTAGEDVSKPEDAMDQHYLAAASGVILLLDPFSFPENISRARERHLNSDQTMSPEGVLDAITYVLQTAHGVKQGKKIKQPIAVVISKIDAFFDQIPDGHPLRQPSSTEPAFDLSEADSIHDHMASMIASWGGDGLLRKLEQNYTTWRLFGASALGAEPDYGDRTRDGRLNSRGVLPHRVAEPLLWLMAERRFIPVRKA